MHSLFFVTVWALLASLAFAGVARYPRSVDFEIASVGRSDLVQRDSENTNKFEYSEKNKNIVDVDLQDNKFKIDCIDCSLTGSVTTSYDEQFPDIWSSGLKISFSKINGHFDLDVLAGTGSEQVIPLWNLGGISLGSSVTTLGVSLNLELVISLDHELEATGGFEFTIPEGSWITVSLGGGIIDSSFDGSESSMIPWEVSSGSTTLKASIRLRAEAGVSADTPFIDIDAGVKAGVYLNIIELVVDLENNPQDQECTLEVSESWNVNAGVYAGVDLSPGSATVGVAPDTSTTFIEGAIGTQCLEKVSQTSVAVATTTSAKTHHRTSVSSTSNASATSTTSESEDCADANSTGNNEMSYTVPASTTLQTLTGNDATVTEPAAQTTTIRSTNVYTDTRCANSVASCGQDAAETVVVVEIVDYYTTVCPVADETSARNAAETVTVTEHVIATAYDPPSKRFKMVTVVKHQ
ncbi:hypothetical protein B0T10DRAFT_456930 [Thelonectria olida]|uniref:Uncharacterized protein n=1 Tax=Thelonectria olida TaxID=1576542 RepID=A0A9P8WEK6_9HYPO|nr:hypothetical protein B0T10DRAFT_456930 [Thelonectria olida]